MPPASGGLARRRSTLRSVNFFVDDFERPVERSFSQEVYGGEPAHVLKREEAASNANEQAWFVAVGAAVARNTRNVRPLSVGTSAI